MTARPDVPDTPDRTDAIARIGRHALCLVIRAHATVVPGRKGWCSCGHQARTISQREQHLADVLTDDPAAVAAIAAQWAERHPEALLTALTNAGVLRAKYAVREVNGDIWLDAHGIGPEARPGGLEHDHRDDAETICAGPPDEAVVGRLVTRWREVQQP